MIGRAPAWILAGALTCAIANAATCTASASDAFGGYNPLAGAQATTTGMIAVTCTGTLNEVVNVTITLSAGFGSYSNRTMLSGSTPMYYNLYRDAAYSQVWGDGVSGGTYSLSDTITLTSTSVTKCYTVYSRIAGNQKQLIAGTYADNVTVTVSY